MSEQSTSVPDESDKVSLVDLLRAAASQLRTPTVAGTHAAVLALAAPTTARALADWFDGEAVVHAEMEPFVELVSASITNSSGQIGVLSIGHDDNDKPLMRADSSPAAARLAQHLLTVTS